MTPTHNNEATQQTRGMFECRQCGAAFSGPNAGHLFVMHVCNIALEQQQ